MNEKVDIVLSVYKPNIEFLEKQLESLNEQTYPNIEVIIHDDCVEERCDRAVFERKLTKIPYRILPYQDRNLGYTKAFERLVKNTTGAYIAFCDQDDIWLPEKIEKCVSFGSVLELMKGKKIKAFQDGNFEEILLTLIKGAEENDTKIQ